MYVVVRRSLELTQYTVHYPVDRCGGNSRAVARAYSLQMLNDTTDDGQLHVRRVGYFYIAGPLTGIEVYGVVGIDREVDHPLVAHHLYAVVTRRLVPHKTPRCRTGKSVLKTETSTHIVFHLVHSFTVGADTIGLNNDAKDILYEVKLVRSEVEEIALAVAFGLGSELRSASISSALSNDSTN